MGGSTNDDGGRGSSRDHDHGCTSDHGSTHGDRGARSTFGDDIRRAAHLLVNGTSAGDQHEEVRCFEVVGLGLMTRRKRRVGLRRPVLDSDYAIRLSRNRLWKIAPWRLK